MQEATIENQNVSMPQNVQNNQASISQNAQENIQNTEQKLSTRSIILENGTIITGLKIKYKNLFDFENNYSNAKDLMEALIKKQTFDHETMVQLIYVGYLGTNPEKVMSYLEFIDSVEFDYKRDMKLFKDLVGLTTESKN